MKYLLLALLLTGCVDQSLYNSPVVPEIEPGPPSTGLVDGFAWRCQESTISDKVVIIECRFDNKSLVSQRQCIQIGYDVNDTHDGVVRSRKVCSAYLEPGDSFVNYGAFFRKERDKLTERCGLSLSSCYMITNLVAGKN